MRTLRKPSSRLTEIKKKPSGSDWGQQWAARAGILTALATGLWAVGYEFLYKEVYLPTSKPGLVQTSIDAHFVGETDCCRLYEVATVFENKSSRDVVIHASHQTIGARRLLVPTGQALLPADPSKATSRFVTSRLPEGENFDYLNNHHMQYTGVPLNHVPLLLAAGNPLGPGGTLAAKEVYTHRSVALVPKGYPFFFVRGTMHVAHVQLTPAVHWHWVMDDDLMPSAIPWRADKPAEYRRFADCLATIACEQAIRTETHQLQLAYMRNDVQNYTSYWGGDFAAAHSATRSGD